eukprot:Gb_15860 [translate_table: standard]
MRGVRVLVLGFMMISTYCGETFPSTALTAERREVGMMQHENPHGSMPAAKCTRMPKSQRLSALVAPPPPTTAYGNLAAEIRRKSHRAGLRGPDEFKSCLPKRFHPPPSAPSHFGNSHTINSLCVSEDMSRP